jgi:hypothetical protein
MVGVTWFLVVFLVVLKDIPLSIHLFDFFRRAMSGSTGFRSFSEDINASFFFHLGTTPFLYLPFCLHFFDYLFTKKKSILLYLGVLLVTMWVSSSRGLLITTIFSMSCIYLLKKSQTKRVFMILMSIPISLFLFYFVATNTSIFDSSEISNRTKIGPVESFFDNINGVNFFVGDGLASYYYSKGSGGIKAHTEVTPIDMLRYFGFILTLLLYLVLFFPQRQINTSDFIRKKIYLLIFSFYVINSFTNPIMFNSYGLLIVLWYWSKILTLSGNTRWTYKQL